MRCGFDLHVLLTPAKTAGRFAPTPDAASHHPHPGRTVGHHGL